MGVRVIYAGRGEGKTSYIIEQCKKLPGNKCVLTSNMQTALLLSHEINRELTHTEIYSILQLTPKFDQLHGKQYDWIFIDELTHFVYSMLSHACIVGQTEVVSTIGAENLISLEDVKPKKSCGNCICYPVCEYKHLYSACKEKVCQFYHEKEEETTND